MQLIKCLDTNTKQALKDEIKGDTQRWGTEGNWGWLPSTETSYLHEEPALCLLGPYLCYCLAATSSGHYLRSAGGSIG